MVKFVCDLCGSPGLAPAPGVAQCATCGRVALVEAPPASPGASDPHAPGASSDPFSTDDPTLLLEDEIVEPAPRLATLWVRPGAEEAPTPELVPTPWRRHLPIVRTFLAVAAGTALAVGGAIAFRVGWIGGDDSDETVADVSPPPGPVAQRDPAPTGVARPEPPARSPERGAAAPARKTARIASTPRPQAAAAGEAFAPRAATLRNPGPADPRCIPKALHVRRDLAARLPAEIAVRFQVAATGAVGRIEVLGAVNDADVTRAIEDAIRSCTFIPGADEDGRPTTLPVVMRVQFDAPRHRLP